MMLVMTGLFLSAVVVSVFLAVTSIFKLHFDNYTYCKSEAEAKCNAEDYKYCATIKR